MDIKEVLKRSAEIKKQYAQQRKEVDHNSENRKLMRKMINYQIVNYRKQFTGDTFLSEFSRLEYPKAELEIDHVIPFRFIARRFLTTNNVNINSDLMNGSSFKLTYLDEKWKDFHSLFPLRPVSSYENNVLLNRESSDVGEECYFVLIDEIIRRKYFQKVKVPTHPEPQADYPVSLQ